MPKVSRIVFVVVFVSKKFQRSSKEVPKKFQRSSKEGPKKVQRKSKEGPKEVQKRSKEFPKKFQRRSKEGTKKAQRRSKFWGWGPLLSAYLKYFSIFKIWLLSVESEVDYALWQIGR